MTDQSKTTRKEAKRLRKAVKRRRTYVENLRRTASDLRAAAQASGNPDDAAFADRIDLLADAELAEARDEETRAVASETAANDRASVLSRSEYSSEEQRARALRASEAIKGRMSGDRVAHLVEHIALKPTRDNNLDMEAVEKHYGLLDQVNPTEGPRLQMGRRIALAETRAFGQPRF